MGLVSLGCLSILLYSPRSFLNNLVRFSYNHLYFPFQDKTHHYKHILSHPQRGMPAHSPLSSFNLKVLHLRSSTCFSFPNSLLLAYIFSLVLILSFSVYFYSQIFVLSNHSSYTLNTFQVIIPSIFSLPPPRNTILHWQHK